MLKMEVGCTRVTILHCCIQNKSWATKQFFCFAYINISESGESGSIHYDDKAIVNLLDRNREGVEEKALLANEYLASFKVWKNHIS